MTHAALPTLRTPRLTLRPLQDTDADAIVAGVGNFDVSKWLGVVPYPYERSDAEAFIARQVEAGGPVWAVCDTTGLIGTVGLVNELGYWFARPAWGKGYGFEAAHAAVTWWFDDETHNTLKSGHFGGNMRSRGVLLSLGFEETVLRTRHAISLAQDVTSHEMHLTRARWIARQDIDIRTDRLRLRPMAEQDAPFIMDLARPEVTRMLYSLKTRLNEGEARAFVQARQWRGVPGFALTIERDGAPVGYVATGNFHGVELYYALHPDYWGQGIMSEAAQAFVEDLFARFPISRIIADRFEDNPASGSVLEKCGFEETGRDMGHSAGRLEPAPVITYALTRDKLRAAT
ncbi:MAG: GNAT family N-acetyltransferase [Pseudomonadota bacterium]